MPSIICSTPLLAHQGGWDEILLVGVPILMIVALLAIATRRVDAMAAQHRAEGDSAGESGDDSVSDTPSGDDHAP